MNAAPMQANIRPKTHAAITKSVNWAFANWLRPDPRVAPTTALPPVPIIVPAAARIMMNGMMMFTAAKAVVPAKFETNKPSIMP